MMKKTTWSHLDSPASCGKGHRRCRVSGALASALLVVLLFSTGCVAKRGVDFGHWARTPEPIAMVRVFKSGDDVSFSSGERVLVLPPVGEGSVASRQGLLDNILREIQYASAAQPFQVSDRVLPPRYWLEDNAAPAMGQFDVDDVVRMGLLFEAPYVLSVHVRVWRPYPPQVLAVHMTLVDVNAGERVADLNGSFNAAEQQVVVAADDWLQGRRARKYDGSNLDIVLRSPSEFSAFVAARTVQNLWNALKETRVPADK